MKPLLDDDKQFKLDEKSGYKDDVKNEVKFKLQIKIFLNTQELNLERGLVYNDEFSC
jgi:hypothetical protein